jgi:hypothetical protein
MPLAALPANRATDGRPIELGHDPVKEREARTFWTAQFLYRLTAIADSGDFVSCALERFL